MDFDRLQKKGTPWHFGEDNSTLTGVSNKSLPKHIKFAVTPSVLTSFVPFRKVTAGCFEGARLVRPAARSRSPRRRLTGKSRPVLRGQADSLGQKPFAGARGKGSVRQTRPGSFWPLSLTAES